MDAALDKPLTADQVDHAWERLQKSLRENPPEVHPDTARAMAVANALPRRKSKGKSPTQRSLEHMRKQGYLCDVVERRLPRGFITKDLYGFIDILCIRGEDIIGVQTTSGSNLAARVTKITEHENWPLVCAAMRVIVHGWRKNAAGKWVLREVEL